MTKAATVLPAALIAFAFLAGGQAKAQFFSSTEGYGPDGKPKLQVEIDPYAWWPGLSGHVNFASPLVAGRSTGNFNTGLLSYNLIKDSLHAAFMGAGIVRDGPLSAEIDIQYLSVSQSNNLFTGPQGGVARVKTAVEMLRVAPGIGYQAYTGQAFGIPVSLDARGGLAIFSTSNTLTGEASLDGRGSSSDNTFVQPWLGARATFVVTPRWRVQLDGMVQGFSVNGSWGYGASGAVSYAMTDWAILNFGARAIETERFGLGLTSFGQKRSLALTTYGPFFGVGFRF
jgi:hypothetical protein